MNVNSIDPLSLPSLPLKNRRSLPNCPAVYFVLAGERILYIGRAINLAQRWAAHHRWNQLLQFDTLVKIAWIECSEVQLLDEIEAALIEQFNPELNGKPNLYGKEGLAVIRIFMPSELREDFKTVCALEKSTMNKVVVELIEGYREQNKALLKDSKLPNSLKELIRQCYFDLMNSGKLSPQRLKELSFGQKASPKERQIIGQVLGLDKLPEDGDS